MRTSLAVACFVLVVAIVRAITLALTRRPDAYPCVESSASGWLTASSEKVVLRVEWGEAAEIAAGSATGGPLRFESVSDEEARRTVRRTLRNIGRDPGSSDSAKAALFVMCDGKPGYWRGEESRMMASWRECIEGYRPKPGCLLALVRQRLADDEPEQLGGAVAKALEDEASRRGYEGF